MARGKGDNTVRKMPPQYKLRETECFLTQGVCCPLEESDTTHPIWLRRQRGEKQWEGNGAGACGQLRAHTALGRGAKANQKGLKTLRVLLPTDPEARPTQHGERLLCLNKAGLKCRLSSECREKSIL